MTPLWPGKLAGWRGLAVCSASKIQLRWLRGDPVRQFPWSRAERENPGKFNFTGQLARTKKASLLAVSCTVLAREQGYWLPYFIELAQATDVCFRARGVKPYCHVTSAGLFPRATLFFFLDKEVGTLSDGVGIWSYFLIRSITTSHKGLACYRTPGKKRETPLEN